MLRMLADISGERVPSDAGTTAGGLCVGWWQWRAEECGGDDRYNLTEDDLGAAPAELRQTLSLACASEKQVSK